MYFNPSQVKTVNDVFMQAEQRAGRFFRVRPDSPPLQRYDVKTRPYLAAHEVSERAFAQLCRYRYEKGQREQEEGFHFYHVCLQDGLILDAVQRAQSFIKFVPLMQYIATHELVHMIRFEGGEMDFDAPPEEKEQEEDRVHILTRRILEPFLERDLKLVFDCFSDQYKIGYLTSN
jgi:hypothetical protein